MAKQDRGPQESRPSVNRGAEFAGVGLQLAGSILLFLFAGQWLDRRLGTGPWLLLLGVFVGFGLGFWAMYRKMVVLPREEEQRRRRGEGK